MKTEMNKSERQDKIDDLLQEMSDAEEKFNNSNSDGESISSGDTISSCKEELSALGYYGGAKQGNTNASKDEHLKVSEQVTLYLTKSDKEKLQANARERDITPSRYVNLMLNGV